MPYTAILLSSVVVAYIFTGERKKLTGKFTVQREGHPNLFHLSLPAPSGASAGAFGASALCATLLPEITVYPLDGVSVSPILPVKDNFSGSASTMVTSAESTAL
ncbi:hypothetical protein DFH07DRAFT_962184 [Mycena maculata]|uniref:Uncharacterized protein n=1 Tax=Mycena maculata TaxID=230809 RepID=A0AAD7IS90_9AGAR|nr:hypothetical protein DFH07DRAFT_962184 [Mycena maculata]